MKTVFYFRPWVDVPNVPKWGISIIKEFSLFSGMSFSHYSNKIPSGTDESLDDRQRGYNYDGFLGWIKKHLNWKLCLILQPIGDPETMFKIGYYCPAQNNLPSICKVTPVERRVDEGPFAMRIGPKKCYFFVIGDKKIELEKVDYISRDSDEAKKEKYEDLKIY